MDEKDVIAKIKELGRKLPKFPDGRINYRDTDYAPVINVFIAYGDELLMFKRSDKVGTYKGKWNTVAGYLDRPEPLRNKALGELREETGITIDDISLLIQGEPHEDYDEEIYKTWLVCPFLVELTKKPDVKLDFEHTECKWVKVNELHKLDLVPGMEQSYRMLLGKK